MAEKHIKKYPNGVTLIYYRQNINSTTNVTAGFLYDSPDMYIAHALEHALFHGTDEYTKEEIYEIFRETGTIQNAATSKNYVVTEFDCPNANAERIFKINGDMLAKKKFNEKELDRELKVILQERYLVQDREGDEEGDTVGTPEQLSKVTTKDIIKFRNKFFVTENMVISVVSSLPYSTIKKYVEENMISKIKSDPNKKVVLKKKDHIFTDKEVIHDIPSANSFNIQFILKGYQDVEKNDLYSRFEDWYFNEFAGKLYKRLRLQEPLVYAAQFHNYEQPYLKLKLFNIHTSPENVNKCIVGMTDILEEAIEKGISEKEFNLFQTTMLANRQRKTNIKTYDSSKLFTDYIYGEKPFVRGFFNKLMALTREDINKYLKDVYGKSKLTVSLIGDTYKAQNVFDPYAIPSSLAVALTEKGIEKRLLEEVPFYTIEEIKYQYNKEFRVTVDAQNMFNDLQVRDAVSNRVYKLLTDKEYAKKINKPTRVDGYNAVKKYFKEKKKEERKEKKAQEKAEKEKAQQEKAPEEQKEETLELTKTNN